MHQHATVSAPQQIKQHSRRYEAVAGCLVGMAVGDALGLPREGLTPTRANKLFGNSPIEHRFILGRGMVSDDTEHACFTAQAIVRAAGSVEHFRTELARSLRWWLLGGPAGIGLATLRSILKLWIGVPPHKSGVRSAGNGPAMRAPIVGTLLSESPDLLAQYTHASTRITHNDPRTDQGALIIAQAAARAASACTDRMEQHRNWQNLLPELRAQVSDEELRCNLDQVENHLRDNSSPSEFAQSLSLQRGVSGYINHTVPAALFCWLRYPGDFRSSITAAIRMGGDTDTVAAITGGIAGTEAGLTNIPAEWIAGICEWPRSTRWMTQLASQAARATTTGMANKYAPTAGKVSKLPWPGLLVRNALFTAIVLYHGFRRLFPPY